METLYLLISIVFVAALVRGLTGFGFAAAAVPAMSIFVPPAQAISVTIVLQCFVGFRDTFTLRHIIERQSLSLLSLGALAGTPIGIWLLTRLSVPMMRIIIAMLVVCGLVIISRRVRFTAHWSTALCSGVIAGLFSGLAAMPGPPAIAYYLGTATPAVKTRASLMVFFFITSLLTLPGLYLAGEIDSETVTIAITSLPMFLFGTWLGGLTFERMGEGSYRTAALSLMLVAAIISAFKGFTDLV